MTQGVIRFYSLAHAYDEFSNFAPYPIRLDGKTWQTSEHDLQAAKFQDPKDREAIRKAKPPMLAARMGRDRRRTRRCWLSSHNTPNCVNCCWRPGRPGWSSTGRKTAIGAMAAMAGAVTCLVFS
ncbi:protein of unknown function (DUF1768) [Thiorhodovibrio frisius]|uniref:Uncharacterized protein n=1 Tax=Thiorhodovibrio frisius TaxID=631362 RepID=H8YVH0_9GAMM|nr:protein of unknown function (DUF1768) [Thiorhodovibrio frisius]WPL23162.1 Swarming motility protein YbiA [Thiorhodovibrio frisius]